MSDEIRRQVLDSVADGRLPPGGPSDACANDLLADLPASYWERWSAEAAKRIRVRPVRCCCAQVNACARRGRTGRALRQMLGGPVTAPTIADLILGLDDETIAQLAERLRPHLVTEDRPSLLLDAVAAAAQLGIHPRTLCRAARAGRVPGSSRVGRSWRFEVDQLALLPPAGITPAPAPPARPRPGASSAAAAIRGTTPRRGDGQ